MTPFNYGVPYDNTQVTVELRHLVESGIKVWDFEYPSYYKGEEKTAFEQKVLDHFWFRQIGAETPARWLHQFRSRIRDIMPYYIQLYDSEEYMRNIKDPFATVDLTETFEEERTGESSGKTSTESSGHTSGSDSSTNEHINNNERRFSNTPQGSIENLDEYLTEATVETSSGNDMVDTVVDRSTNDSSSGTAESSDRSTVKHTFTKFGAQGVTTFGHDMIEFRQSFLNVDLAIINELNDLFLMVY